MNYGVPTFREVFDCSQDFCNFNNFLVFILTIIFYWIILWYSKTPFHTVYSNCFSWALLKLGAMKLKLQQFYNRSAPSNEKKLQYNPDIR